MIVWTMPRHSSSSMKFFVAIRMFAFLFLIYSNLQFLLF